MNISKQKLSVAAKIWCLLCIIASIVLIKVFEFKYDNGNLSAYQIISFVFFISFIIGYIVLLAGKKAGFFIICAVAVCNAFLSVIETNILQAILSFVNPLITWLLIRQRWGEWEEIDREIHRIYDEINKQSAITGVKSRKVALVLASIPLTGWLGIDRFYLGYIGTGLLKFITFGGIFAWWIVDIIRIKNRTILDKKGRPLR